MTRRSRILILAVAGAVVLAVGAAAAVALTRGGGGQASAASATVPAVGAPLGLSALDGREAPGFSLVDQRGRRVSLASLRGRVVVLEFFDPACTDICPIVSREYVEASRLLGPQARQAAFVAVNVNEYHRRVADVARFSRLHGLGSIPGWHFLTGATPALRRIWHAYGVTVEPNPDGDVVHSALTYFIDAEGRERYLSMAGRETTASTSASARAIAGVVRTLLPAA